VVISQVLRSYGDGSIAHPAAGFGHSTTV